MTVRARHLARLGQAHLEEAILDVLYGAHNPGPGLYPSEISEKAGISPSSITNRGSNDIVKGFLGKLEDEGKVQSHWNGFRRWRLTDSQYKKRRS